MILIVVFFIILLFFVLIGHRALAGGIPSSDVSSQHHGLFLRRERLFISNVRHLIEVVVNDSPALSVNEFKVLHIFLELIIGADLLLHLLEHVVDALLGLLSGFRLLICLL